MSASRTFLIAPSAAKQIRDARSWWIENRPKARTAFVEELRRGFRLIVQLPGFEYPWHWESGLDPRVGVLAHGCDVVSEENAILVGGPCQHGLIVGARETYLLNSYDIEVAISPENPAYDVEVEILVSCEAKQLV